MAGGFRYTDEQGVEHLVETLAEVPPSAQKTVRPVGKSEVQAATVEVAPRSTGSEWLLGVHLPSAAGGAALVVLVAGVVILRRAGHGKAVRLILALTAAV